MAEVVWALAVALVVGLVPGVAWSRLLADVADGVERVALSIALSLCLVPAVAALLAAFGGGGVTRGVALVAPVLVATSGWLALWLVGPAPRAGGPTVAPRPRVSSLSLGLLGAASIPILATAFELLPERAGALATGALVLASVAAHALGRRLHRRGEPPPDSADAHAAQLADIARTTPRVAIYGSAPETPTSRAGPVAAIEPVSSGVGPGPHPPAPARTDLPAFIRPSSLVRRPSFLAALILLLVAARGYVGPILYDWPYLRGQDLYAHAVLTNLTLERGDGGAFLVYPPGLHALTAVLVRLSGIEPLRLYALLAPALLLLPALGGYAYARAVWGRAAAVAAAGFAGLLLATPWYYLRNGTYADLIAAGFLLVLAVGALAAFIRRPSRRGGLLWVALGSGVVLYHSVATIYLALLAGAIGITALPVLMLRDRARGVALLGSLAALALVALAIGWGTYDVPGTLAALLGRGGATGVLDHAAIAIGTDRPFPLTLRPVELGQAAFWLGVWGTFVYAWGLRAVRDAAERAAGLIPVLWVAVLLAGSLTSLSGFPTRFHRDLGFPLALFGAWALTRGVMREEERAAGGAGSRDGVAPPTATGTKCIARRAALIGLALACAVTGAQLMARAVGPSEHLFMRPEYEAAGRWLGARRGGGTIVVTPQRNQVPANAMLALGGYAGLPGYTAQQLARGREVAARDRDEVRAAHAILRAPGSARARTLLRRYGVEYVVLYERFPPGTPWEGAPGGVDRDGFRRARDLYAPAYRNDAVTILRVLPEST